jgi:hypothetical protein
MTPTEHELTVATDAVARRLHQGAVSHIGEGHRGTFDQLDPMTQHRWREAALPFAVAALEALPCRGERIRDRVAAERDSEVERLGAERVRDNPMLSNWVGGLRAAADVATQELERLAGAPAAEVCECGAPATVVSRYGPHCPEHIPADVRADLADEQAYDAWKENR